MADTGNPKPARTRTRKKKSARKVVAPVKPTIVHTKRKKIEGEDGWIHIVDKPRTNQQDAKAKKQPLQGGDFELKGVSYVNRTLVEMKEEFEHWKRSWEERPTCQALKEKMKDVEKGRRIVNVVVLGLGSLQSARREGRRSSATQLAALQTIVDGLENGTERQIIFQDPQFTRLDKELLTTLGYKILEDPEAFAEVVEGSLVYAIHCYAPVYKAVAQRPRPAVLIGTNVGNFVRFDASEDTTAKELEKMVEGYEVVEFPQLRHDFSDTKIYLRPAATIQNAEVVPGQQDTTEAKTEAEPIITETVQIENTQVEATQGETIQADTITEKPIESKSTNAAQTETIPAETTQKKTTQTETTPAGATQEETPTAEVNTAETQSTPSSTATV
ncbi:hypothetical protein ONS95_006501 [Cadophora gregata]|uniref:uncharacterized protein n=1 Tax=Cadophora gregata TaxID=51156 RepID=UPI0026DDA709|nr:uncharacterized protein ONS95_006501 [Cadophora gregata]KAK0101324.1 hypothetical protein ONS95_006501 [Cadophora gregata]KAK0106664.1 hypothetical protein ONS96_004284 [Cadophora gregata f. sp. sojae]